ncbi:DNA recombination protein RmuC, partial [bacterium]|nr:DNA recombination protein RmuC [bacterium]
MGRELREEFSRGRLEAATAARSDRDEQSQALDRLAKNLAAQVGQLGTLQGQQLESFAQQLARLTQSNEQR